MKKGFTIVELLAVLAIMTVILLMAVPAYTGIVSLIHQRIYDSKIKEVLAKSEMYSEEYGKTVFNIKALIESGKIEADNESGVFEDPRDGRDMSCDMINVLLKDGGYDVSITEDYEKNCYDADALENLHGITTLKIVKSPSEPSEVDSIPNTKWLPNNEVYATYELKDDYQEFASNVQSILWYGEEEKVCSRELGNLEECKFYKVSTNGVLNTEIHFQITIQISGVEIQNENRLSVLLDREYPIVLDGSITTDDEYNSNSERRVQFELSDKNGSGVKEYAVVKYDGGLLSCNVSGYTETSEGVQTTFLDSGSFYICAKDKVGNVIDDETLNREKDKYIFTVDKMNTDKPKWKDDGSGEAIKIESTETAYNSLNVNVSVNVENADGSMDGLKVCVSTSGYLQGCTWVNYTGFSQKIPLTLPKQGEEKYLGYDGGSRTVYVSVQDKYGNVIERTKEYVVYQACTPPQNQVYIDADFGTCSKSCGGGMQYKRYEWRDQYVGAVCSSGQDSRTCNTHACDPVLEMNPNDYNSSKNILCNNTYAARLLNTYSSNFRTALDYQPFRNAMYDCASVMESIIRNSSSAISILRSHSRTTVSRVKGRSTKSCSLKCPSNCNKGCSETSCYGSQYYVNAIRSIYSGKALIISASSSGTPCSGSKCTASYCSSDFSYCSGDTSSSSWSWSGDIYIGQFDGSKYVTAERFKDSNWTSGTGRLAIRFLNNFGATAMAYYDNSSNSTCQAEERYAWSVAEVAVQYFII